MINNNFYLSFRTWIRNRILDLLGSFSVPQPGIHILNGHRIQEELEPDTFRILLEEMAKYVSFVKVEDAVQMIINKEMPTKPIVAFTFDDGFMDCYNIFAPVLEEFGVNALFFINPNYVDGDDKYITHFDNKVVMTPNKMSMRWSHLEELAKRGHIIGAHTMDHYMVNSTNETILKYQIETCKGIIENKLGKPCAYFAFPYGKLTQANEISINIAANKYKFVFSQSDYKNYFSFDGKVINRRHFEPFWPKKHVFYFLSCNKKY